MSNPRLSLVGSVLGVHLGPLDGASEDPDVAADCPPVAQILPALGDTLAITNLIRK